MRILKTFFLSSLVTSIILPINISNFSTCFRAFLDFWQPYSTGIKGDNTQKIYTRETYSRNLYIKDILTYTNNAYSKNTCAESIYSKSACTKSIYIKALYSKITCIKNISIKDTYSLNVNISNTFPKRASTNADAVERIEINLQSF